MKIEIHGEPSFYTKRRKQMAQVVVLIGEGAQRRSTTRHAELKGGRWFGLNPDERAIPLNNLYTADLINAKAELAGEQATLNQLLEKLAELEAETPEDILAVATRKEMLVELKAAIDEAHAFVMFAKTEVEEAELKLRIVQQELPLEVEFTIF